MLQRNREPPKLIESLDTNQPKFCNVTAIEQFQQKDCNKYNIIHTNCRKYQKEQYFIQFINFLQQFVDFRVSQFFFEGRTTATASIQGRNWGLLGKLMTSLKFGISKALHSYKTLKLALNKIFEMQSFPQLYKFINFKICYFIQ